MFKKIRQIFQNIVIRTVVERVPFLKNLLAKVDGKKALIGRVGVFVSILIAAVQTQFPDTPYINEINTHAAVIIAWIFQELGLQHQADKLRREELYLKDEDTSKVL